MVRRNNGGAGFASFDWEPLYINDTGPFVVTVPPGGNYVSNVIVYDADFVDLNNDDLPDWVETEAGGFHGLRVTINNHLGVPGRFIEARAPGCPANRRPARPTTCVTRT